VKRPVRSLFPLPPLFVRRREFSLPLSSFLRPHLRSGTSSPAPTGNGLRQFAPHWFRGSTNSHFLIGNRNTTTFLHMRSVPSLLSYDSKPLSQSCLYPLLFLNDSPRFSSSPDPITYTDAKVSPFLHFHLSRLDPTYGPTLPHRVHGKPPSPCKTYSAVLSRTRTEKHSRSFLSLRQNGPTRFLNTGPKQIKLPTSPHQELYFDPQTLSVSPSFPPHHIKRGGGCGCPSQPTPNSGSKTGSFQCCISEFKEPTLSNVGNCSIDSLCNTSPLYHPLLRDLASWKPASQRTGFLTRPCLHDAHLGRDSKCNSVK